MIFITAIIATSSVSVSVVEVIVSLIVSELVRKKSLVPWRVVSKTLISATASEVS
ncbi:hypothetical protein U5922_018240 [Aquicoccus sp. G2-2]|uniref:hypothetical protein n=1 Tax=Aquicoccus sp. G2-2 TaxID=3092120 RepID=UPI002AE0152B|nr:hypothetical protein [Aquicoccus sp. G2-2]MEA1115313.1 hypothetical protein [Aquicoccus sp. G2-2]